MSIELASAIMELACAFRRQFSIASGAGHPAAPVEGGEADTPSPPASSL
jgi:hypothetical protein